MCEKCGCISNIPVQITGAQHHTHGHGHTHGHDHLHEHSDGHYHSHSEENVSKTELLKQNILQAERNRGMFEAKNVLAIKIVSSQGSGKSMLIEKSIERLIIADNHIKSIDNEGIRVTNAKTINIKSDDTDQADAEMVFKTVKTLEIKDKSILFIENLTNIPSKDGFQDSGEKRKVFVFSVTEGDDKAVKYPELFSNADVCVISKTDLLPYVDFDTEKAKNKILALNPSIRFFEISAKTGSGINEWISWIIEEFENFSK
jgi:hydrogenase nickel incorporation protein HypB